jgi:hypothetical protein
MNNRNKNNSIIFLTTLSVYLGLVLVGATPSVLAQAATTRTFNVQDEIEVKDDLDKKPNDYDGLEEDIKKIEDLDIATSILSFIINLKKLESIDKLQPQEDLIFSHIVSSEEFTTTAHTSQNSDVLNPWLKTAIEEITSNTPPLFSWISDYTPNCNGELCREDSIRIESNANEFSLTFLFTKSTPEKAKLAAEEFNRVFVSKKVALKNAVSVAVYENTKSISENNQVFIVTRLPRGSLDELLKQSAKADK